MEAVAELEGRVEEVLVPLVAQVEHPVAVHLPNTSSLLSFQVLEGPWALNRVIHESTSLKYEPHALRTCPLW